MRGIVDDAIDAHARLQARKIPIHERPPLAARMLPDARGVLESTEHIDVARVEIELRAVETAAAFQRVLVDEEDLVDRAERIDLELVVAIIPAEEHLDVVVEPDERIALRQGGAHLGLLDPE